MKSEVHNCDCIEFMKTLPDKYFDLCIADPPYRDIGENAPQKEMREHGNFKTFGNKPTIEMLNEFARVSKHQIIWGANNFGYPFKGFVAWDKQSKICGRYYMGQIEHIFMLRKGKDKPINNCGCSDLLSFSNFNREKDKDGNNLHDSIKPISLMQCMIENSTQTNEIVLDPFMGSGTTALACIRSKRHYIGCEIDRHYYNVIQDRIRKESQQLRLF